MAIKLILNFRSRSRLRPGPGPGPGSFDWSRPGPGPGENLGPGRTIIAPTSAYAATGQHTPFICTYNELVHSSISHT